MKRKILPFIVILVIFPASCSKQPAGFIGSWKTGEQGFFSTAVVLILRGNGTAEISAAVGVFGSTKGTVKWRKEGDKLILQEPSGQSVELTILGKTETSMTLRGPDGSITTYTKIGDAN